MASFDHERQAALDRAIVRFGEAWANGDMATLRELLSPSYTHNDAFGARHDYESWLTYVAKRTGRQTRIAFRDVKTRFIGDVAVITGYNEISGGGVLSPDDDKDFVLVFTQVWVWRDNGWKREAFQATPVKAGAVD
ncbi:MAG: nuclear transport factor 2 family protein [Alphaproteobacteria bacterium]|nr:nuclear transport factor 2 family protein [Alphaproteobacteria bacterium]